MKKRLLSLVVILTTAAYAASAVKTLRGFRGQVDYEEYSTTNVAVHASRNGEELLNTSQDFTVKANFHVTASALRGGKVALTRNFDVLEMRSKPSGKPRATLGDGKSAPEETVIRLDTTMFDSMITRYTFTRSGSLRDYELRLTMNDTFATSDDYQSLQGDYLLKLMLISFASKSLAPGYTFTVVEDTSFNFGSNQTSMRVITDYVVDGPETYDGRETLKISFTGTASFSLKIPEMFTEPLEFNIINSGFFLYDYSTGLPLRYAIKSVNSGKTRDSDTDADFTYNGVLDYNLYGTVR